MPRSMVDMVAVGKLFEEHRPRLRVMLQRRIDPALQAQLDADDLLSETFLAAFHKWEYLTDHWKQSPYSWLYRLALDCLTEAWRRATRQPRDLHRVVPWPECSSIQLGLGLVGTDTEPAAAAVRAELQEQMRRTLDCLKEA